MGICLSGYGNPDGADTNGCECTKSGAEVCDGIDNDCDGLVDYYLENGVPKSMCKCDVTPPQAVANIDKQCGPGSCAFPTCSTNNAGKELGIDYSLGTCVGPNFPWAQCKYETVYLNAFDADHGNTGILEVSLCVDGVGAGERMNGIGIYYGPYPGRKHYKFFSDQELSLGVSNSCYTKYFRPSDALCDPEGGLASTCLLGCPNGKWGTGGHTECVQNYDATYLWLTAEGCQGTAGISATVSKVKIQYLNGPVCTCQSDTDCRDLSRPHCDLASKVCVAL